MNPIHYVFHKNKKTPYMHFINALCQFPYRKHYVGDKSNSHYCIYQVGVTYHLCVPPSQSGGQFPGVECVGRKCKTVQNRELSCVKCCQVWEVQLRHSIRIFDHMFVNLFGSRHVSLFVWRYGYRWCQGTKM